MNVNIDKAETLDRAINVLEDGAIKNAAVSAALVLGDIMTETVKQSTKEYKVVNDFFESDSIGNDDKNLKKLVAAAAVFAKQSGVLPQSLQGCDTTQIASVVDACLTQAKVAYKTGKEIYESPEDAIDELVDRSVARLCALIDEAIPTLQGMSEELVEKELPKIITLATTAVESAWPETAPVMDIIREFTPFITEAVKPLVKEGVAVVGSVTKNLIRSLADKIKITAPKLVNLLKA